LETFVLLLICIFFSSCPDNDADLPVMYIHFNEELNGEVKKPCTIDYFPEDGKKIVLPAKIKRRGGFSYGFPKHSYSLKLDSDFSFAGMNADDNWYLISSYIDKTLMRHKISYDLFRSMGNNNIAPHCTYVILYVNNDYHGIYQLTERLDKNRLGVSKSDTSGMIFKEPMIFFEGIYTDYNDSLNYYHQRYPEKNISDRARVIDSFKDFMFNSPDSVFSHKEKGIIQWLDIDNIIDWHLLVLFTNNADGIKKGFYFYKKDSDAPFRMALWDYDHCFGRDGDNEMNMNERPVDCTKIILFKRLLDLNPYNYKDRLKERWAQLKKDDILSENNFLKMVEENYRFIKPHVKMNFERWSYDSYIYFDDNNFETEVNIMKEFIKIRIPYIDKYIKEL